MTAELLELKTKLHIEEGFEYTSDKHNLILSGIPKSLINNLIFCLGITKKDLLGLLPISDTNLRRMAKKEKFKPQVTEHIIAISEVVFGAEKIFGNRDDFKHWLFEKNIVLNDKRPYDFLSTIHGCGIIKTIFHKIAHGISF